MLNNLAPLFLQFGSFGNVLMSWENLGVFDLILPFLLVFAVVFGILSYLKIFGDNRGIHAIVAVILGLLAIRAQFFSDFLSVISPRLGVGLIILVSALVLIGLFIPQDQTKTILWVLMSIGAIIFVVIMAQAYYIFGPFGLGGLASTDMISYLLLIGLIVAVIVVIVVSSKGQGAATAAGNVKAGSPWS